VESRILRRPRSRVLEEGKFQVAFFDDRLAMPDRYGNDHKHTVENGIRCVKMDPHRRPHGHGRRDEAPGTRGDAHHDLLRAIRRGPGLSPPST
jgi:hypothetical protein